MCLSVHAGLLLASLRFRSVMHWCTLTVPVWTICLTSILYMTAALSIRQAQEHFALLKLRKLREALEHLCIRGGRKIVVKILVSQVADLIAASHRSNGCTLVGVVMKDHRWRDFLQRGFFPAVAQHRVCFKRMTACQALADTALYDLLVTKVPILRCRVLS